MSLAGAIAGVVRALQAPDLARTFTLRRTTTTYDPATNTSTTNSTDYSVTGVEVEYDAREIDGQVVRLNDVRILVPAQELSVTPTTQTDELIDGSDALNVVAIRRTRPGDTALLYEFQVRR